MSKEQDWIWYELMTTEPEAAAKFYSEVTGWKIGTYTQPPEAPTDATPYWLGMVGDRGVVGIMAMPTGVPAAMPPNWSGYIHAPRIDEQCAALASAGGSILRPPFDIPGVGRVAVVADPQGGRFNLLQPFRQDAPAKLPQNTPGNISWCELHSDTEDNFDFYQQMFGWHTVETMDMGQYGTYRTFTTNDNPSTGGSMRKMKEGPEAQLPTYWLFYFSVDGIEAAIDRVRQSGGTVFMGPHQVPGDTWIAMGRDPQGATFALHSMTK